MESKKQPQSSQSEVVVERDTITRVDTVRYEKPYPKYIERTVEKLDTLIVTSCDTIRISLPYELKTYEDSTYRCTVKGIDPTLESIEVYPKTIIYNELRKSTEYCVEKKRKPHLGGSVGVGYGYGILNQKADIFIGGTVGIVF